MLFSVCSGPALLFLRTQNTIGSGYRRGEPKRLPDILVCQITDDTRRHASSHHIIGQIVDHCGARADRHSTPDAQPRQHGAPQPKKALLTDANATTQQGTGREMRVVLQNTVVPNHATHADEASCAEKRIHTYVAVAQDQSSWPDAHLAQYDGCWIDHCRQLKTKAKKLSHLETTLPIVADGYETLCHTISPQLSSSLHAASDGNAQDAAAIGSRVIIQQLSKLILTLAMDGLDNDLSV